MFDKELDPYFDQSFKDVITEILSKKIIQKETFLIHKINKKEIFVSIYCIHSITI